MKQTTFALTPEQAAQVLQVNQAMIYKMIKNGELLAKKVGKRLYRISPAALSWVYTGLDFDIAQMAEEDKTKLDKIYALLKAVREK